MVKERGLTAASAAGVGGAKGEDRSWKKMMSRWCVSARADSAKKTHVYYLPSLTVNNGKLKSTDFKLSLCFLKTVQLIPESIFNLLIFCPPIYQHQKVYLLYDL